MRLEQLPTVVVFTTIAVGWLVIYLRSGAVFAFFQREWERMGYRTVRERAKETHIRFAALFGVALCTLVAVAAGLRLVGL